MLSTTSFTVTPSAFFASLMSASGIDANATLRCGVIDRFIDRRGAVSGSGTSSSRSRARCTPRTTLRPRLLAALTNSTGRCASEIAEWLSSSRSLGTCSGSQSGAMSATLRLGFRLRGRTATARISTPDAPSINEWWILATNAWWPRSRPSTTHASHSGWRRSSGTARDIRDERGQLGRAAGRGDRGAAQVVVEVEVGVLDPQRRVQPERHLDEPAAERRHEVQPRLHQLAHVLVTEPAGATSSDRRRRCPSPACARWASPSRERRVETREPLHQTSGGAIGRRWGTPNGRPHAS